MGEKLREIVSGFKGRNLSESEEEEDYKGCRCINQSDEHLSKSAE